MVTLFPVDSANSIAKPTALPRRRRILLLLTLLAPLAAGIGCQRQPPDSTTEVTQTPPDVASEPASRGETEPEEAPVPAWRALLVASAGASQAPDGAARRQALDAAGQLATRLLEEGEPALRVAEAVITELEDSPLFNAGRGSTLTRRGTHELDAAIVDGRTGAAGSVSSLRNVRNPVQLARRVLENPEIAFLTDGGADQFARARGATRAPQDYFTTSAAMRRWQSFRAARQSKDSFAGSVGIVVKDRYGNLAAATSSGGHTDRYQQEPDGAALIGAGLWADNATAAVVAIGSAPIVVTRLPAREVSSRLAAGGELTDVVRAVHADRFGDAPGRAVVAVDRSGRAASSVAAEQVLVTDLQSPDTAQE